MPRKTLVATREAFFRKKPVPCNLVPKNLGNMGEGPFENMVGGERYGRQGNPNPVLEPGGSGPLRLLHRSMGTTAAASQGIFSPKRKMWRNASTTRGSGPGIPFHPTGRRSSPSSWERSPGSWPSTGIVPSGPRNGGGGVRRGVGGVGRMSMDRARYGGASGGREPAGGGHQPLSVGTAPAAPGCVCSAVLPFQLHPKDCQGVRHRREQDEIHPVSDPEKLRVFLESEGLL